MKKLALSFFSVCFLISQSIGQSNNTFPNNGNVGIGTTSPSAKMDVNGNMKIDSSLLVKDSVTIEKNSRVKGEFVVEDDASFLKNVFINENLNVAGKIHIVDKLEVEGNVVIDSKLSVGADAVFSGPVNMGNLSSLPNLSNPNLEILILTPSGEIKKYDLGDLFASLPLGPNLCTGGDITNPQWQNGLNKLFSACDQVFVGIGTDSPEHKLDVRGNAYSQTSLVGNINGPTDALINGFVTNNSQALIQLGHKNGSSPHEVRFKITNEGIVYAKELRIRHLSDFPDYVFEDDYHLMPLRELAEFIEKNKHLPKMPTASEVKSAGMAVGELQILMVEKIEELTLYMIDLKEENDQLKSEIDQLKIDIEEIKSSLK